MCVLKQVQNWAFFIFILFLFSRKPPEFSYKSNFDSFVFDLVLFTDLFALIKLCLIFRIFFIVVYIRVHTE